MSRSEAVRGRSQGDPVEDMSAKGVTIVLLVTIEKFATMSGYTANAVRGKIQRGDWLEGKVFVKAPDDRILIDLEGYDKWARGQE
jgi:hypothetical protein